LAYNLQRLQKIQKLAIITK